MDWIDNACLVILDGDVDNFYLYSVMRSYGRKKSPYTSTVDRGGAWGVESDGSLVNGYNIVYVYFYGRIISPDIELFNMQYAWHVSQYGDTNIIDAVYDLSSYGINKI